MIIRNRNAAIRITYLMSSIYFAPGTARESEVCGSLFEYNAQDLFLLPAGYMQLRALSYASGF